MRSSVGSPVNYRFCYTKGARSLAGFQSFDGMTDLEVVYQSEALFPVLLNRLLPKPRPEYNDFLRWNDFNPSDPPEPLVLLQRSEGIKKTDAIEVFPYPVQMTTVVTCRQVARRMAEHENRGNN